MPTILTIKPEIGTTDEGTQTLLHPTLGEYYHSTRGAVGEAQHVYIEGALDKFEGTKVRIFEMGFGSGLNAYLTLLRARERNIKVDYTTIDLYPVSRLVIDKLEWAKDPIYVELHTAPWGQWNDICNDFRLKKVEVDLVNCNLCGVYDIVYFDAFAPSVQPELWTEAIFRKLYNYIAPGGVLVTYSAAGSVKSALRLAGFEVSRQQGAMGKHHMLVATKSKDAPPIIPNCMERKFTFDFHHYDALSEMDRADQELVARAKEACKTAYAPYSNFNVGAAALLESGKIIAASNQESEVYPSTMCAERSLLFYHQANMPNDKIVTLAIASMPDTRECYPCGQCRQTINDVQKRQESPIRVIMCSENTATIINTAIYLLPFTFEL